MYLDRYHMIRTLVSPFSCCLEVHHLFQLLCVLSPFFICFPPEVIVTFRSRVIESYWSLSCDHGLHCSDDFIMREQQQQQQQPPERCLVTDCNRSSLRRFRIERAKKIKTVDLTTTYLVGRIFQRFIVNLQEIISHYY